MNLEKVNIKNLLEAGIHFGHKTKRWNPKMEEYIYGERNGIHIIDLKQTLHLFLKALEYIKNISAQNKNILFVGTKRQASEIISATAMNCEQYYINNRWLGGMLTNWDTIQNSIRKLKDMEELLSGDQINTYTKKESLKFEKSVTKLNKALGGIKNMNGKPDLLFIIDTNREFLAVQEANKIGIPIVAVVDSNSNPEGIDYPIPGNDDAMRSIEYYCSIISNAIIDGRKNIKSNLDKKIPNSQ